ncbi:hypothetical protein KAI65_05640 [Candidatus Parcubacteria bacterium]|nr:hypothetical protein [Candidatus Parcubacteria bacterium]
MKESITQEQKNKILMYFGGGLVFVLLSVVTFLGLSIEKKQSRDIIRLSAIKALQSDLFLFYSNRNKFPERILVKKEAKKEEECFNGLCLDNYPVDPLSNERYSYIPCYDAQSENCEDGAIDAKGYIIKYRLESGVFGLKSGIYETAPHKIY